MSIIYNASNNKLPDEVSAYPWLELGFGDGFAPPGNITSSIVADAECYNGYCLKLSGAAGVDPHFYYCIHSTDYPGYEGLSESLVNATGWEAQVRMKLESDQVDGATLVLGITDNAYALQFALFKGNGVILPYNGFMFTSGLAGGTHSTEFDTTQYHTYRLVVLGSSFSLYIDSDLQFTDTLNGVNPSPTSKSFGITAVTPATAYPLDARIDVLAYDIAIGDLDIEPEEEESAIPTDPSGFKYEEYYLYSDKSYELVPSGVSEYSLENAVLQNAPIVVTPSGWVTTTAGNPWAQTSGIGKYIKKGWGYFTRNSDNTYASELDEFTLHPDSSGKIVFNKNISEDIVVEYESGISGHYILDSVDFNPIRAESEGGFIHYSRVTDPTSLYLMTTQNNMLADGSKQAKLVGTLYDEDYDRVSNQNIVFEIQELSPGVTSVSGVYSGQWSELGYLEPGTDGTVSQTDASGYAIKVVNSTDSRGEARAKYTTHDRKTGIQNIKAYYQSSSGVYDAVQIAQYYITSAPFQLDLSLLDMLDYLT